MCLASLAGNPSLDIERLGDRVSDLLSETFKKLFPYSKDAVSDKPKEVNYNEYFKELEEMKKKIEAEKAAKTGGTP